MDLTLIRDIPSYSNWNEIKKIPSGWSIHNNYKIKDKSGNDFILMVSDINYFKEKKRQYENIFRLADYNFLIPKPMEFGLCNQNKHVYMLLTWIEGKTVEDSLLSYNKRTQYELGVSAGGLLKGIHTASKISSDYSWLDIYTDKIETIIKLYHSSNIHIENEDSIVSYIQDNRSLLSNRPQVVRHGSFHGKNLIITNDKEIAVVGFDKCDYGDPWEEFEENIWSLQFSEDFMIGQIDGYFNKDIPEQFFSLLALYSGVHALQQLVITNALYHNNRNTEGIINYSNRLNQIYNGFKIKPPLWFR